ncbi:Arginase/deacetylase [Fomitiporia mediterranea MF3/22]|uniref:Arginase/deacetylase n=1 Tax=Fomitiporia mediterranea (strain MF3/22) TaxID=694068 RepID=UPI000440779C|nr:Arginase/deacetylase [Fomitiporia mediterranea MF3/22]EJD03548.1 Arginase/deacetylase [Fomitiporia mediterranea MF3/22]
MKVFYDSDCLLHNPPYEILDGKQTPYHESPSRINIIRNVLAREPEKFQISDTLNDDLDLKKWTSTVHQPEYLDYLETAYDTWVSDGGDEIGVFPETFPHVSFVSKRPLDAKSLSPIARAGLYCFDLSSPITKETFKAILASLKVTLNAAKTLPFLNPKEGVFALCRPPGHHSAPSLSGGYCFCNNIAVAARFLQSLNLKQTKVAILDIDYHHGNGTQAIFYNDPTVFYVSLHAEGDYPYFSGFVSETGEGKGEGFNLNIPLPRGTTSNKEYFEALTKAVNHIEDYDPVYLLVSLGVDTHEEDPISDFKISTEGYLEIGRIISSVKKPELFVLEGGYHLESIGQNGGHKGQDDDSVEEEDGGKLSSSYWTMHSDYSGCAERDRGSTAKVLKHYTPSFPYPPYDILDGRQTPYHESPSRINIVRNVLAQEPEKFQISDTLDNGLDLKKWILTVHEPDYFDYLETAYDSWISDGGHESGVFPGAFLHVSLLSKKPLAATRMSPIARAGLYCFGLSAPITKDTLKSTLTSLRVTLTAAEELPSLELAQGVFALCQPPGHHAGPSLSGGYCFINNIAVAAQFLQSLNSNKSKVAILDIDYHHGNGSYLL